MKKIVSILLVLVLLVTSLQITAFSAEANQSTRADSIYTGFLESFGYLVDPNNYHGNTPTKYAFLDINKDGVQELLVQASESTGFCYTCVYTINDSENKVVFVSDLITYGGLSYSSKYKSLEYTYPRPAEWENIIHFSILLNNNIEDSFSIIYDEYDGSPKCTYITYDSEGNTHDSYSITESKRQEYINTCEPIKWTDLYKKSSDGLLYKVCDNKVSITGYEGYSSEGKVIIPSEIENHPVIEIQSLAFTDPFIKIMEIPKSIKTIHNSAFYSCFKLNEVRFTGTKSQWDSINVGDNNEYLIEASLHTEFDAQAYKHCYAKVIYDAIKETKITYTYAYEYGYGIIQDVDGNGEEELLICHFSKNINDLPVAVCSVYTMHQNVAIPLVEGEELFTDAGGPYGECSIVEKDGKKYIVLASETGGTSSTATRTGRWDLYSLDGDSITKVTDIDYKYYRENGSIIYNKSSSTINGEESTYSQYRDYIVSYKTIHKIVPHYDEMSMPLEELLEYTNTLSDSSIEYDKTPSFSSNFADVATNDLSSVFNSIITKEMLCKTLIEDGGVELVTWNAFLLSLKSLSEFKLGVDEKSFYQAILFDLISDTYSSIDYEKEMKKSTVDMVDMFTDFLIKRGVDLSKKEFDQADLKNLWSAANTYMMAEDIKITKEAFDALIDGCDKADECIEVISIYAVAMRQGQNLVEALKLTSLEAINDPNAKTLKESIDELIIMLDMTPLELTHYVLENKVIETGTNAVVTIVCDFVLDTIKDVFPIAKVLNCIKIADWGSNLVFPTSLSSEQQYRIYALYHIECIARQALFTSISSYKNNSTEHNAEVMVSCYDMYVRIYEHEIVECEALAELLYKKGIFNGIKNCFSSNSKEDYDSALDWIKSYNVMLDCAKEFKEKIYINWGIETGKIKSFKCIGVADGKIAGYTEQYVDTGSEVTLPDYDKYINYNGFLRNNIIRVASRFEGWYYDEECTRPCFSSSIIANEHIVRYAKFSMNSGKQLTVKCPVDVEIYKGINELCVRIVDNKLVYSNNELRVDIVDNTKSVFVPDNMNYSIKLTAYDKGSMNYSVTEINEGITTRRINFYDVPLYNNQVFSGNIENGLNIPKQKYSLSTVNSEDENVVINPHEEIDENALQTIDVSVSVEGDGSASGGCLATKGDYVKLVATPDKNSEFIGWYVDDKLISNQSIYSFVAKESVAIIAKFIIDQTGGYILGDTDGDGKVTIVDATYIQRHLAQLTTLEGGCLSAADTDRDGGVTIIDATHIQRFLAKLIPNLDQTKTVSSISVCSNPTKTIYYVGESLDASGLELKLAYSDGSFKTISSGFECSPTDLSSTDIKEITVAYKGKTTKFAVTVKPNELESIKVKNMPLKTTYVVGDPLEAGGLTLTATYSNGSSKTVDRGYSVSPSTLSTVGTQTITVSWGGKKTTFTVTVEPKGISYSISGNTLTISGNGKMSDYSYFNAPPWQSQMSSIKNIVIESGVTKIGDFAFNGSAISSIAIPSSVTAIGRYAFYNCRSLTSITIPKSVTTMGDNVFSGCHSMTNMTVASGNPTFHSSGNCIIETANKTLFSGCKNSKIPTDGSVTCIGANAFSDCTNLSSISIPGTIKRIESNAFSGCTSITSITIPNGVTFIGNYAFAHCESLYSISIPASVKTIGYYTFYWCTSLRYATFANKTGWYITETEGASTGTSVSVDSDWTAAVYLRDTYSMYYWYCQ